MQLNHAVKTFNLVLIFALTLIVAVQAGAAQTESAKKQGEQLIETFAQRATATLKGQVNWKNKDLSQTTVQVYRDKTLTNLYTGVTKIEGGRFSIRVEPGSYYVVAFVDVNRSGKFDDGDGMGILGIADWRNTGQQKQLLKVGPKQTISGLMIHVTARNQRGKIVSAQHYRPDPIDQFKSELEQSSSGVKGIISYATRASVEKTSVRAYTDLSWKYLAAKTGIESDGSFTLHLNPGKYYLMVIIDWNDSNLIDHGDWLGIHGITNLQNRKAFPEPILVAANKFTKGVQIQISGKQLESGRVVPLVDADSDSSPLDDKKVEVSGKVLWRGHNLDGCVLQVYVDPTLTRPVQQVEVEPDGSFKLQLRPGDFYMIASVDADGNGQYGSGDGVGGYGTMDMTTRPPAALTLKSGENAQVEIVVSAQYDVDGQLKPTESKHKIVQSSKAETGLSGRIIWDGKEFRGGILSLSDTPTFSSVIPIALNLEDNGRYTVSVPPGDYYVTVAVDIDADGQTGLKDGVGVYGTRQPVRGKPQLVSVFDEFITQHIDIEIFAMYIDSEGNIAEFEDGHRSEIKYQHGDPEDIFRFTRFGRELEEWCYWTLGHRFTFSLTPTGWKLHDQLEFEPKVDQQQLAQAQNQLKGGEKPSDVNNTLDSTSLNAAFYYSYDGIIWEYHPRGALNPVGAGSNPTVARNGRLAYLDTEGNVLGQNAGSQDSGVLLSRQQLAKEIQISPSGDYIAFTQQQINRQRIVIRHLPSNSELLLPSTAQEMGTPRWSRNEEILAYSTLGSIENVGSTAGRNIFAYDRVNESVEPIVIGNEDDADPAWSPSDANVVAFSRAEGNHRQIWLIRFNKRGESSESQLTRYGGENPVWLPDGSTILYENNGQLWLISRDGGDSRPVIHKGQILYGNEPCVVP